MKTVLRLLFVIVITFTSIHAGAEEKKIVLIAGNPSHRSGEHEHRAGMLLFQKCLASVPGVSTLVISNGWPADSSVFENAAAVVIYADGGQRHPALQGDALETLAALNKKSVGFACIHYAVEPTIEKGQAEFLSWLGGCFEINWSVNPHWTADFKNLPEHPVTRGVKPFQLKDEWYYHMRFAEGMKGVTPVLSDVPSTNTLTRPDGPHSGNPAVREAVAKGEPQHVAWAFVSESGARGFGTTGGHFHKNWADDNFRKLVLNAILWTAKAEVPANGVESTLTTEDLQQNLDPK